MAIEAKLENYADEKQALEAKVEDFSKAKGKMDERLSKMEALIRSNQPANYTER